MKRLRYYEIKKIICKKEMIIVFFVLIIYFAASIIFTLSQHTYTSSDTDLSGFAAVSAIRKSQIPLEGALKTERIEAIIQKYLEIRSESQNLNEMGELKDAVYIEKWQQYENIENIICNVFSKDDKYNPYILAELNKKDGALFYDKYNEKLNQKGVSIKFSDENPIYYGYHLGWINIIQNLWIHSIVISLCMCILFSGIFAGERECGMESILKCAKYGKKDLNKAKFRSGFFIASILYIIPITVYLLVTFLIYGIDGYDVSIQSIYLFSALKINLVQTVALALILAFTGYMAIVTITLYFSKKFKHSLSASLVVISILIIPIFIPMPKNANILQNLLYLLPSNLMNASEIAKNFSISIWIGTLFSLVLMTVMKKHVIK